MESIEDAILHLTHGIATPAKAEKSPEPSAGVSMTIIACMSRSLTATPPEQEHAPQVKKRRIVDSDDEGDVPSEALYMTQPNSELTHPHMVQ